MLTIMPTDASETYLCAFCVSDTPYEDAWRKVRSLTVEPGCYLIIAEIPVFKSDESPQTLEDRAERMLALAERYHQTNLDVMRKGICLPIRLGFVIGADESAIAAIRSLMPQLWSLFDQVRGREEWSVKVTVPKKDFDRMTQPETETPDSGAAYLRRRQQEKTQERERRANLLEVADTTHALCANESVMALRLERAAVSADEVPIFTGAYLVETERAGNLMRSVDELQQRFPFCRFQTAGPWPPYSFVQLQNSRAGDLESCL